MTAPTSFPLQVRATGGGWEVHWCVWCGSMQRQDLRVKTRRSGCILMTFNVKCLNHSADRLRQEIFTRDKRVTGACFILIWASVLQRRTKMCTWSIMRKIAANIWILRAAIKFLSTLLLDFLDLGTWTSFYFCHLASVFSMTRQFFCV